jgi:methyl-accepting chemotaxis protein
MSAPLSEIEGKHHKIFVPTELHNSVEYQSFWANLAKGKPVKGIFNRVTLSGQIVNLNAIYNPIPNATGEIIKVVKYATVVN